MWRVADDVRLSMGSLELRHGWRGGKWGGVVCWLWWGAGLVRRYLNEVGVLVCFNVPP